MESCAILQYLGEKFPTAFYRRRLRWDILPLYWQANVGPVFGNNLPPAWTLYLTTRKPIH